MTIDGKHVNWQQLQPFPSRERSYKVVKREIPPTDDMILANYPARFQARLKNCGLVGDSIQVKLPGAVGEVVVIPTHPSVAFGIVPFVEPLLDKMNCAARRSNSPVKSSTCSEVVSGRVPIVLTMSKYRSGKSVG